jgi:hypothetical protein
VSALLVRPSGLPGDALGLLRLYARDLQTQLRRADATASGLPLETRAHLKDSLDTLTEALKATMTRS